MFAVTGNEIWSTTTALDSERLHLERLTVEHADEMVAVLDDPDLHVFIGGRPATREELRARYEQLVVGHSRDGSERWLNWVIRRRDDGRPVGTVQATVTSKDHALAAEIAWVIGTGQQRQGFAREAARAMVGWLRERGVTTIVAHVHPQHEASMAVARALGLSPTEAVVDGEVRWEG
jgi:RimJ/RimL family protein N-acetyltransferase